MLCLSFKDLLLAMECILPRRLPIPSEDTVQPTALVWSTYIKLVFWLGNLQEVRVVWRNRQLGLIPLLIIHHHQEPLWCSLTLKRTPSILLHSSNKYTCLFYSLLYWLKNRLKQINLSNFFLYWVGQKCTFSNIPCHSSRSR